MAGPVRPKKPNPIIRRNNKTRDGLRTITDRIKPFNVSNQRRLDSAPEKYFKVEREMPGPLRAEVD